jgi:hypothetical protein
MNYLLWRCRCTCSMPIQRVQLQQWRVCSSKPDVRPLKRLLEWCRWIRMSYVFLQLVYHQFSQTFVIIVRHTVVKAKISEKWLADLDGVWSLNGVYAVRCIVHYYDAVWKCRHVEFQAASQKCQPSWLPKGPLARSAVSLQNFSRWPAKSNLDWRSK